MAGRGFDGSSFIAIDSDAFGNGLQDPSTLPLDTWVENALDNNARYLKRHRLTSTYVFPHDGTTFNSLGFRRFSVAGGTGYLYIFTLPVAPDYDRVRAWIPAFIDRGSDSINVDPQPTLRSRLWHIGGKLGDTKVLKYRPEGLKEGGKNPEIAPYSVSVEIDEDHEGIGVFALVIRSVGDRGAITTGHSVAAMGNVGWSTDDMTTTRKEWLRDETRTIRIGSSGSIVNTDSAFFNVLATSEYNPINDNTKSATSIFSKHPVGLPEGIEGPEVAFSYIDTISPASIIVETTKNPDVSSRGWVPKSPPSMRANKPVLGEDEVKHQRNVQSIYEEPRVHYHGPVGEPRPDRSWNEQHSRWTNYINGQYTRMDASMVFPVATGKTRFTWYGAIVCGHTIKLNDESWSDAGNWQENIGSADVRFDFAVRQLDTISSSRSLWSDHESLANESRVLTLDMWPAEHHPHYPVLNQMYWRYWANRSNSTGKHKTQKEGILFRRDVLGPNGSGPVQLVSLSVELEVEDLNNPLQWDIHAYRSSSQVGVDTETMLGDEDDPQRPNVLCVSSTLIEEPIYGG